MEDDQDFAEILQSGLCDIADVRHVNSIAQARAVMEGREQLDVIILDWSLPDGDAVCLLDEIEDLPYPVRILGLSSDGQRAQDGRVSANLVKSRAELDTIAEHVAGHRTQAS
ncbi:hypothetical protein ACFQFQ_15505 [Sulfitobacter porphyrae]|uniref:Response regulatory domain-containing protein n=1 Tax=Sulfitobacter porphyrae TaxID=1246864 RepID=A0ABW2B4C9_9RHOB